MSQMVEIYKYTPLEVDVYLDEGFEWFDFGFVVTTFVDFRREFELIEKCQSCY